MNVRYGSTIEFEMYFRAYVSPRHGFPYGFRSSRYSGDQSQGLHEASLGTAPNSEIRPELGLLGGASKNRTCDLSIISAVGSPTE